MPAYKDAIKGTWYVAFYFTNWQGQRTKKMKRGFGTKKEALAFEREFLQQATADLDMTFEAFVEIYRKDLRSRLKENTWITKEAIIDNKILPYFKDCKISAIQPKDIIQWQNLMMEYRNAEGEPYSPVYLKTLHNQLSAIFNHAVRYYDLSSNPARKAGNMGKETSKEAEFWTKEEYLTFLDAMMDKPISYYSFQMLYWSGMRVGELLALTVEDIDLEKKTVRINKSYQRINGRDVVTTPKTEKSNRTIVIPDFLCEEMGEFIRSHYKIKPTDRLFTLSKSTLHQEMKRGTKATGVKRIKIHGLRHSHISALIDMGFSAVDIAARVGHESIDITYRYAHMFPSKQHEIANMLTMEV